LINSLNNLPGSILQQLVDKVQALAEKYATTFADVMNEIDKTKSSLALQIDELTGNEFDMKGLSEFKVLLNAE
jgi:type I restriction enzyme M protein